MPKFQLEIQEAYTLIDYHLVKAQDDQDLAIKLARMDRVREIALYIEGIREK